MFYLRKAIYKQIIFVFAGLLVIIFFNSTFGEDNQSTGTIVSSRLSVRSAPDQNARLVSILKKDVKVDVLGYEDGWVKIKFEDIVGYVRNRQRYIAVDHSARENTPKNLPGQKIDELKKKSQDLDRKIKEKETQIVTYTQQEMAIVSALEDIEKNLMESRQKIAVLKTDLDKIDKQILDTETELKSVDQQLDAIQDLAAKRLVAYYKLTWLGKLHVLASADSIFDMMIRKKAMASILAHDEKILNDLLEVKTRHQQLISTLSAQKAEKKPIEDSLNEQIRIMSVEKEKRNQILKEVQTKKTLALAAVDIMKKAAADLDQAISDLITDTKQQIPDQGQSSFSNFKGLLQMPVKGKVVTTFGMYRDPQFNIENFRSGIDIKAERGEPIQAVFKGKVLFAKWFKGYGNMIIIEHDDNYYSLYAHADELFKQKGDNVDTNEVIATVGDTGSMQGYILHFEIRHHGKPEDPLKWLNQG